jgi:hypothetical protein
MAAGVRLTLALRGEADVRRALERLKGQALPVLQDACRAEGQALHAAAQALVPVASGELRDSSRVTEKAGRMRARVRVLYTADKAAAVHQGVHGSGQRTGRTRGFRWLARAWEARLPGLRERVLARLRSALGLR